MKSSGSVTSIPVTSLTIPTPHIILGAPCWRPQPGFCCFFAMRGHADEPVGQTAELIPYSSVWSSLLYLAIDFSLTCKHTCRVSPGRTGHTENLGRNRRWGCRSSETHLWPLIWNLYWINSYLNDSQILFPTTLNSLYWCRNLVPTDGSRH